MLDEPLHDVQPQARARHRAALLVADAVELLEDHRGVLGREADPVVADDELDAARGARRGERDLAAAARDAGLERVVEQVAEHGLEHVRIDFELQVLGHVEPDRDLASARSLGDLGDRARRRAAQRDVGRRERPPPFLEPRRVEQVIDHPQQPLAILEDP